MIARGKRDDTFFPRALVERGQPMPRAANLERADWLQRLSLKSDRYTLDFTDE
jgi:hypothetical protein